MARKSTTCAACGMPLDDSGDGLGPEPIVAGSLGDRVCGMVCLNDLGAAMATRQLATSETALDMVREVLGLEPGAPIVAPSQREEMTRWGRS